MSTKIGVANNYLDLLDTLNEFLCDQGHAWGKRYTGVGNGTLTDYIGTATSVAETFTVTAINSTTFSVVGSVSGSHANATVGTPYVSSRIKFTINAGSTSFQAGDTFVINTSPKWERLRYTGCIDALDRYSVGSWTNPANAFDGTTAYAVATAFPARLGVDLHKAGEVNVVLLTNGDSTTIAPRDVALEWSDDKSNWTTAQTWTGLTWTGTYETKTLTATTPPGLHRYWRFRIDSTQSGQTFARVAELQLRESASAQWSMEDRFEAIWRAPGLDGTKNIYVGISLFRDAGTDVHNWLMRMWRFYDAQKSMHDQHNPSTQCVLSLANIPINYWIVANGQRVIVVCRVSTVYQLAYLGFGYPYEPPSTHPWPAIIAGTSELATRRWSSTDAEHRLVFMPGDGMHAYYPDNLWRRVRNRSGGSGDDGGDDTISGKVWPATYAFNGAPLLSLRDRLDGGRVLIPCTVIHAVSPIYHMHGELDGVYWTSGYMATAESIIHADGHQHLVINNVHRTAIQHWGAVRLD